MSRPADPSPDAALRANVRLLGEILGRVLGEQEGEDVYRLEERIRLLARLGRRGDAGASRALAETIALLGVETQAVVLRAFTVYFHLANIAEQHHRVRRRREVEREGGVLRESLDEALAALEHDGVPRDEVEAAARRVSVELVLTAHPTEALPRTILEKHRRIARAPRGARRPPAHPCRALRPRGRAGGGGHDPLADGRGQVGAAPRRRRDPAGALVSRGQPVGRRARPSRGLARAAARLPASLRLVGRRRSGRKPERRRRDGARGGGARRGARTASSFAATSASSPPRGGCRARWSTPTPLSGPSTWRRRGTRPSRIAAG